VLITRPNFDRVTSYLFVWSKEIIKEAKKRDLNVFQLNEEQTNRKTLEKRIEKNDPALVLFNGHGSPETITGHKKEILIKADDNEGILKSRIVHSFSCNSARTLGPKSVEAGAKSFIGYIKRFVILHDEKHTATPKKDNIAKHFLESANTVPISLIKGNTVKEAYEKSQASFEKSIEYYKTHYSQENSHILFFLKYDKSIQRYYGNENATLLRCVDK
jgi:hypothetical protein